MSIQRVQIRCLNSYDTTTHSSIGGRDLDIKICKCFQQWTPMYSQVCLNNQSNSVFHQKKEITDLQPYKVVGSSKGLFSMKRTYCGFSMTLSVQRKPKQFYSLRCRSEETGGPAHSGPYLKTMLVNFNRKKGGGQERRCEPRKKENFKYPIVLVGIYDRLSQHVFMCRLASKCT